VHRRCRNEDGGVSDPLSDAGAAYIFQYIDTFGWFEIEKLMPFDAQADAEFGGRVGISGDTAVVGARYQDGGFPWALGAAYVIMRNLGGANQWAQARKLTASNARRADLFGTAVAASSDHLVIGAMEAAGPPGNPVSDAGAAYVFRPGFLGAFIAGWLPPGSAPMTLPADDPAR
jgi:hypothetical protein